MSSAFSFKTDTPDAVLHVDRGTPNRSQPCGPSIWPVDVSLICDIETTWSRSYSIDKRRRQSPMHVAQPCLLRRGCLAFQIALPAHCHRPCDLIFAAPEHHPGMSCICCHTMGLGYRILMCSLRRGGLRPNPCTAKDSSFNGERGCRVRLPLYR